MGKLSGLCFPRRFSMQDKNNRSRQIGFRLHLYLSLILGFFFALLGLSGSLSLYGEALDEFLNPELVIENPSGKHQPLDRIMAAVRAAHPDRRGSWVLEMPRSPGNMLTAWYENPRETAGKFHAPLMVSVNPYTAEVVSSRFWGETAATWLLDLHSQFHLGRSGWNAVGWLGLALTVTAIAGIYLWWPGFADLRRALTVRHDAGIHRLALDLHRLVGLYSAAVLLIVALTGFNLVFPKLSETLAGSSGMGHGDEGPTVRSSAIPNERPVGLDEAVLLARGPFPHAEVRRVATPDGPAGTYRVTLRQRFEANRRHPVTTVWVDRYSGQIREVRNPARFTAGETALTWLWPLHTGEAWGAWGRFFWFLAGLAPALLYVTGVLRWLISRGWMRDFSVDFSPLRHGFDRMAMTAARLGRDGCRMLRPVLLRAWERAGRHVRAGVRRYREQAAKRARW
jgi:uncharacterized iron-regulated membrane protein